MSVRSGATLKGAHRKPDTKRVDHGQRRGSTGSQIWRGLFAVFALLTSCLVIAAGTAIPAAASTSASQVAAGGRTTCAVMTGGNAYCWGDNTYGQLGNGTTTSSATPVLVSGGYTWATISTQVDPTSDAVATTCAVTTSGAGYCWGNNAYGNVGDGTTSQRLTPTAVLGGYTWASISVGWTEVCGLTTGGIAYCWGLNFAGAVGDNTGTERNSPTAVNGGYTWAELSQGYGTTCGVTTAGAGYC